MIHNKRVNKTHRTQTMATKAQQLKKELTHAFPELKFSVKTEKKRQSWSDTPVIYFIRLTVTGLLGSPYTKRQVEKIANKYENDKTATYVTINNFELYDEIMKMVPNYQNNWETVHKIADNEFFTVLPDGYYEEKTAEIKQSIDEPIEYKIESIVFNNSVFNSADQFIKHIQSWYKNDPKNLPNNGLYDKVDFTIYFGNGKESRDYTMRLYISQTDDNPFTSENLLYNHFLAFCEEFKSHPSKDFHAELKFFSKCDWGQSKIVDIKSQYYEYLQDKLSRKEYDTIITLEAFKDKFASMPVKLIFP